MRRRRSPLVASPPVSSTTAAPDRAGPTAAPSETVRSRSPRIRLDVMLALGLAAGLTALGFLTSSSSGETVTAGNSWSEIALVALGVLAVGALVVWDGGGRRWGATSVGLFAAFTALAGLSIAWSVIPDRSWFGADQLLAYLAIYLAAGVAARLAPARWPAVLGGLAVASAALCLWSLIAKVFPASLDPFNVYGRLTAPFGYWNALGAVAALGIVPGLWWGSHRAVDRPARLLRGLAAPALMLMIAVTVLSLSRTALLVAVVGAAIWLALVPLRLRSLPLLAVGGLGALGLVLVVLGNPAVSGDNIAIAAQDRAGHGLGLDLLLIALAVTAAGVGVSLVMERLAPGPVLRRRIGGGLLALLACVPVLAIAALAASSRGLFGEISHAWTTLTSTRSTVGDTSQRLTQLGSSRPLYWHQGLVVGSHALLKGVGELGYGIARLRDTTVPAKSDNAHSYVIQTFADLGLIGVGLTFALLIAWARAAWRAIDGRQGWQSLPEPARSERIGLIGLLAVVVAFGVQSSLDWTWSFPGVAAPALVAAGWLAGRGPLGAPAARRPRAPASSGPPARGRPLLPAGLLAILALGLVLLWVEWEPLHSAQALGAAEAAPSAAQAFADANSSVASDPLATVPHLELSGLLAHAGRRAAARSQLVKAVDISRADPTPWVWLAQLDLADHRIHAAAAEAVQVLGLDHTADPMTAQAQAILAEAQAQAQAAAAASRARRGARPGRRRRAAGAATRAARPPAAH
jgi:hypothetical protein